MLVEELACKWKRLAGAQVAWGNESRGDQALAYGDVEEGWSLLTWLVWLMFHISLDLGSWRQGWIERCSAMQALWCGW